MMIHTPALPITIYLIHQDFNISVNFTLTLYINRLPGGHMMKTLEHTATTQQNSHIHCIYKHR